MPQKTVAIQPGLVSPQRQVPSHIERPPYAISGDPGGSTASAIRTDEELVAMRNTGAIAAEILLRAVDEVAPGVTTDHIDAVIHEAIISADAYPSPLNYRGFPKSVCTSINEVICHGIPDSRSLLEGDIINVDVTVYKNGVHGDTSVTLFVGDPNDRNLFDEAVVMLVKQTHTAFGLGIQAVKVGRKVSDIGLAIEQHANKFGLAVVREFIGHSVGTEFHGSLAIPHYFDENHNTEFEAGMTFTIEPMLNLGEAGSEIWDDEWTAVTTDRLQSAQFEHTLVVAEDGAEILTQTKGGECAQDLYQQDFASFS